MQTYLLIQDDRQGPFTPEEIAAKLQSGECSPDTLAWQDGMADWQPLRDVLPQSQTAKPPPIPSTPPPLPSGPALAQSMPSKNADAFSSFIEGFKGLFSRVKNSPKPQPFKWYDSFPVLFGGLLLFWPLGLICVWLTKRFEKPDKWRLTALCAAWLFFLWAVPESRDGQQRYSSGSGANPASTSRTISPISWEEIHRIYDVQSSYTEVQKEENWSKYRGKRVLWVGEVVDVNRGVFGGTSLNIRMNRDTFTFDLLIELKGSSASAASRVHKGESVRFTGTLKEWGTLLPITLDDGEILWRWQSVKEPISYV